MQRGRMRRGRVRRRGKMWEVAEEREVGGRWVRSWRVGARRGKWLRGEKVGEERG